MVKITLEVSEETEATASPWWIIIDPRQNFKTDEYGHHNIASMVTGPFFSRKEAKDYLESRRYNFGKNAQVYCHTGHKSAQYHNAYKDAKRKKEHRKEDNLCAQIKKTASCLIFADEIDDNCYGLPIDGGVCAGYKIPIKGGVD